MNALPINDIFLNFNLIRVVSTIKLRIWLITWLMQSYAAVIILIKNAINYMHYLMVGPISIRVVFWDIP